MRYLQFLIYPALFFITQVASAQYYDTGQDPASVKWMQIKTGKFTVIYPETYEEGGKAFARSLDDAYSKLVNLFPDKKIKIPVVLHPYSTQSNGYVAWAPRRMEIYPTPEQNTIPLDPNTQLAVHELAHVFQLESLNTGFTKAMTLLTGQQIVGAVSSLLPLWFLEGDAVFAETALTESGRGRIPAFQKQLRALTVENNGAYKYDKSLNGSYRDFVPDHYESGYQTVTYALAKYDSEIWNRVLKFTGEEPFTLVPVNISLTKSARQTKKKLYLEAFDTLKTIWTNDVSLDNSRKYESLNPDKHGQYVNYYSPVFAGNDSIIAIRTSLSDPPAFVLINPSKKSERKIHIPGQMYPWLISYSKGKIVWVESQSDKRWENRDYSVIKILDLKSRQTRRLSIKSRYMSASASPDGKIIAAVENTPENINRLVLIDSGTGKIMQSVPAPGNAFLQRPQWTEDGNGVTIISLTPGGEGILSYSFHDQKWKTIVDTGRDDLQSSFLRNDSLFFISSHSGTDNIYLKTPDNKITIITNSRFGTNDLCLRGNNIVFSDYTSGGNTICRTRIAPAPETGNIDLSPASFLINRVKIPQPVTDTIASPEYTPVPYRKWQNIFRFHSWMPFYADIEQIKSDPASIRPGITLLTQNNLSTVISSIGYEYSQDKKHVLHTRITWKGIYPVIESQLDYGNSPMIYKPDESLGNPPGIQPGIRFTNSISLPFQFSSGSFSEFLRPSLSSDYSNKYVYIKEKQKYDYGQTIITGRLYFSNYFRSALRDIYPRWAQIVDLSYTFAPFDRDIYGTDLSLKTAFYFPGLLPNNGIKIRFETEKQGQSKLLFGNRASFPRGYRDIISRELNFGSVDYFMPLVYPDLNISSLFYLKRIRGGLFFDYASGTGNYYYGTVNGTEDSYYHNYRESFRSYGFEVLADFHVLRIPFMISGGVQTVWKNLSEKPSFGLLFNIDLYGMTIGKRQI